jgi:membrane protein implicated in regulation of membrane protease activity
MIIFWIVVLVAAMLIEAASFALISVWFAFGAAAALIATALGAGIMAQAVIFVAVSAILLVFTRPIVKKLFPNKFTPTNSELYVGKSAVVIEEIDSSHGKGRVKLGGVDWIAVCDSGKVIPKDTVVTVLEVRGAKLAVDDETAPAADEK